MRFASRRAFASVVLPGLLCVSPTFGGSTLVYDFTAQVVGKSNGAPLDLTMTGSLFFHPDHDASIGSTSLPTPAIGTWKQTSAFERSANFTKGLQQSLEVIADGKPKADALRLTRILDSNANLWASIRCKYRFRQGSTVHKSRWTGFVFGELDV